MEELVKIEKKCLVAATQRNASHQALEKNIKNMKVTKRDARSREISRSQDARESGEFQLV